MKTHRFILAALAACLSCSQSLSRPIELPLDDGAHPINESSQEWWYYSSHLVTDDGRELGFAQIVYTSLRAPGEAPIAYVDSTVTDVARGQYHFGGRQVAEGPPAIQAGAFELRIGSEHVAGGNGHDQLHSVVDDGTARYEIDLQVDADKPPVLHLADASVRYYSRQRMKASGTIVIDGEAHEVRGETWFDHQFGPQRPALATVAHWTWIAAQLFDRRELFLLVVIRRDGTRVVLASLTDADGKTAELTPSEVSLSALGSWSPPDGGCVYPAAWSVRVPSRAIDLRLEPVVEDQEIRVPGVDRYWEGDVRVTRDGGGVGWAYVELYGFCRP